MYLFVYFKSIIMNSITIDSYIWIYSALRASYIQIYESIEFPWQKSILGWTQVELIPSEPDCIYKECYVMDAGALKPFNNHYHVNCQSKVVIIR